MASPALFLDRDGVINVDDAYVHRVEQFVFVDGIFELARGAHRLGWPIFVVTNQAGIGRGLYGEAEFHSLTGWMCERFAAEGAPLTKVYHCPLHPTEGRGAYRADSSWRKPGPGMLLAARDEFGIELARSVLVGDKGADIDAGRAAGIGLNLWFEGRYPRPAGEVARVATLAEALARLQDFADYTARR